MEHIQNIRIVKDWISLEQVKSFYNRCDVKSLNLIINEPSQTFYYQFADLVEAKKCELISSEWLSIYAATNIPPTIVKKNKDSFKYGDLGGFDGSFTLMFVDKYVIRIIKTNGHILKNENCEFVFKFDENNEESMDAFYNIFSEKIKEKMISIADEMLEEEKRKEEEYKLKGIITEYLI